MHFKPYARAAVLELRYWRSISPIVMTWANLKVAGKPSGASLFVFSNELDSLFAGADVTTGKRINVEMNDNDEWHAQWERHADQVLPSTSGQYCFQYAVAHNTFCLVPSPVKATSIRKGKDGMPLLPEIDTKSSNPTEVALVVEEYIAALWSE